VKNLPMKELRKLRKMLTPFWDSRCFISKAIPCCFLPFLIGCEIPVVAPPRAPGIPATAVWAGGIDGGAWLECAVDTEHDANWCLVWNEQAGTLMARTYFVLGNNGQYVPKDELDYAWFSGSFIELTDGRRLVPLAMYRMEIDDGDYSKMIEPPRELKKAGNATAL
jgi:hypothetical protein